MLRLQITLRMVSASEKYDKILQNIHITSIFVVRHKYLILSYINGSVVERGMPDTERLIALVPTNPRSLPILSTVVLACFAVYPFHTVCNLHDTLPTAFVTVCLELIVGYV